MREPWSGGVERALRALLLLPLVAGVLAMHVLLLCAAGTGSGADPMTHHAGHGVGAAGHASAADTGPIDDVDAAGTPSGTDVEHPLLTLCLAVLVALVALLLGAGRGRATRTRHRHRGPTPVPRRTDHPSPRGDLPLLLCVSRT